MAISSLGIQGATAFMLLIEMEGEKVLPRAQRSEVSHPLLSSPELPGRPTLNDESILLEHGYLNFC